MALVRSIVNNGYLLNCCHSSLLCEGYNIYFLLGGRARTSVKCWVISQLVYSQEMIGCHILLIPFGVDMYAVFS